MTKISNTVKEKYDQHPIQAQEKYSRTNNKDTNLISRHMDEINIRPFSNIFRKQIVLDVCRIINKFLSKLKTK